MGIPQSCSEVKCQPDHMLFWRFGIGAGVRAAYSHPSRDLRSVIWKMVM